MAIKYLAGNKIEGLSTDTKPTNAQDGAEFTETNTGNRYRLSGGTWTLVTSGGGGGGGSGGGGANGGLATKSGNASDKVFTISHGLGATPRTVSVIPSSSDALGNYTVDVDNTNITITYQVAPASGNGNLEFYWMVSDSGGEGMANTIGKGTVQKSGDAAAGTKTFSFPHGMTATPVSAIVIPTSVDALGDFITTVDSTNITVTYQAAPPTGNNNLSYFWMAADADNANVLTTSNIKTMTNKTVDSINNTLKNLGSAAYEVFTDATNWYARNTKTGVITSTNTNLTTVLQAAINGLTTGRTSKETVKVKGSGNIAKITIPSYTTLDLRDAKLTLIALTSDHMFVNSDTVGGNTQIEIIGGYIDGNNDGGQGNSGTGDEDLKNVIHLQNVTDSFVLYTYITDTVCRGVRLRDSSNCIVAYNTINDTGAEGIQTRGGHSNKILFNDVRSTRYSFITTYQTPNTLIHGNYCDTVISDSTSGFNISSLRTIVSNNRIYNNGNSTISLSESTSTYECSGSRIINNYVHGSRFGGGIIGVGYRFHDLIIAGNEVYNCAEAGIRISGQHQGVIIMNNIVHDNQHAGINVGGTASTSDPREVIIIGNICYNNGKSLGTDVQRSGITIFGTNAAGVFDVIIANNICYDTQTTKTQKYGIRAVNSDNCIINNNIVRGNETDGMILTTNTNLTHHSNKGYSLENIVVTTTGTETLTNKTYSGGTLSGTFTLPTGTAPITFSKPQGGAEVFWDMTVDDASGSRIRFANSTGGAGLFSPQIAFRNLGTNAGLLAGSLLGEILDTSDTGSVAVFRIDGRIGSPAAALLANRPMFDIANFGGQRYAFYNNRLVLGIETGTPQSVDIEIGNTTTGTRIGTSTTQKIAFHNATPVAQAAFIASPTADVNSLKTAVDAIRTLLINKGLMASS